MYVLFLFLQGHPAARSDTQSIAALRASMLGAAKDAVTARIASLVTFANGLAGRMVFYEVIKEAFSSDALIVLEMCVYL